MTQEFVTLLLIHISFLSNDTILEMVNRIAICVIFLTIPIAFGLQKFLRISCRNEALFKGKYRNLTVTSSSSHVISLTAELQVRHCARGCTKNTLCKSFAFNKLLSEDNCKLLDNEKSGLDTSDIISSSGWILYDPIEQVGSSEHLRWLYKFSNT